MRRIAMTLTACSLLLSGAAAADTTGPTEISGFVDGAYFHDFNAKMGTFTLDQVEVDIFHEIQPAMTLRADLEWIQTDSTHVAQLEQAFMTYALSPYSGLMFGKWNAPIGFEAIDPVDMYQYSHSLVWEYGAPSNLTGLRWDHAFGSWIDTKLYVTNGWDADLNENRHLTWGGRLGFTSYGLNLGLSAISGKEGDPGAARPEDGEFTRTVLAADLKWGTGHWIFGGELNTGKVRNADGSEQKWWGFLLMGNYSYSKSGSFTVRWDLLDDQDGRFFTSPDQNPAVRRQSFTLANVTRLAKRTTMKIEVRFDGSDRAIFRNHGGGGSTKSKYTAAAQLTYAF